MVVVVVVLGDVVPVLGGVVAPAAAAAVAGLGTVINPMLENVKKKK